MHRILLTALTHGTSRARFAVGMGAAVLLAIVAGASARPDDDAAPSSRRHWAFVRPSRLTPPDVRDREWTRNAIDAFILARLERERVAPSPEADRATLIRRLSLDLLGLPPTVDEVDKFVADARPDAYERLVDRLLDSPHYGERWGRHWLDAARYADSNGYTIDGARSIWKYRDWVIQALNADLPFDQFTIWQMAGDMLPGATVDQIIATGFHRNTLRNEEGGTDQEQFRVEAVADRINTTGSVFLGLTIGCARCHDHKYDPVSQREYYQLFALLNNADEPSLPVPTTQQSKEEPALLAEIAEAEKRLKMVDDNLGTRQSDWEKMFDGRLGVDWTVLDPIEVRSAAGATMTKLDDKSVLVGGSTPARDTYTVVVDVPAELAKPGVTAIRLEALTHDSLPQRGPGRAGNGNFVLNEFVVTEQSAVAGRQPAEPSAVSGQQSAETFSSAIADHSQDKFPVAAAVDGKLDTGWAINTGGGKPMNVDRTAVFVLKAPITAAPVAQTSDDPPGNVRLAFALRHEHTGAGYLIGRFRLAVTTALGDAVVLPESVRAALTVAPAERSDEQKKLLAAEFRKVDKERIPIAGRVDELKETHKQLKAAITTSLVMSERKQPRETYVHFRGDFLRPGDRVDGGVPAVFPPIVARGERPDRLDLARWLVDPANPLTARVTVNRAWQQFFGAGLVATENDFGTQGTPPTHPELLDWLATELVERDWSLKSLHRLIVSSATYRQSSRVRQDLTTSDPNNKLLARQVRLRLEAETIRDVALAASDLLSRELGGPGIYPPQPEEVYRFTQVKKFWKESQGDERFRRGLYTYFWRSSPHPFLTTFDVPDMTVACTRRVRSNTPLQALTLANDRAFFEITQALAARMLAEPTASDKDRLRAAFQMCLAREPNEREAIGLAAYLDTQRAHFSQAAADAALVAPKGHPTANAAETAAWVAVARVLINLDEFITRE